MTREQIVEDLRRQKLAGAMSRMCGSLRRLKAAGMFTGWNLKAAGLGAKTIHDPFQPLGGPLTPAGPKPDQPLRVQLRGPQAPPGAPRCRFPNTCSLCVIGVRHPPPLTIWDRT